MLLYNPIWQNNTHIKYLMKALKVDEIYKLLKVTEPSEIDGLHLSEYGHKALGEAIAKRCLEILV